MKDAASHAHRVLRNVRRSLRAIEKDADRAVKTLFCTGRDAQLTPDQEQERSDILRQRRLLEQLEADCLRAIERAEARRRAS